ncbi:hypothetical protein COBT_000955 [Conglomerata obtusa]
MRKQLCRDYSQTRTCKYGSRCHFTHAIQTSLVNPPRWIFTHRADVPLQEFSHDEMRAYQYQFSREGKMQFYASNYDQIWVANYELLCKELDRLTIDDKVVGFDDETVDFRNNFDVFVKPFDKERVYGEIMRKREENQENVASVGGDENSYSRKKADNLGCVNRHINKFNGDERMHRKEFYDKKYYYNKNDNEKEHRKSYNKEFIEKRNYNKYNEGENEYRKSYNKAFIEKRNYKKFNEDENNHRNSYNNFIPKRNENFHAHSEIERNYKKSYNNDFIPARNEQSKFYDNKNYSRRNFESDSYKNNKYYNNYISRNGFENEKVHENKKSTFNKFDDRNNDYVNENSYRPKSYTKKYVKKDDEQNLDDLFDNKRK